MKKQIIIIEIMMILLTVVLIGCNESNPHVQIKKTWNNLGNSCQIDGVERSFCIFTIPPNGYTGKQTEKWRIQWVWSSEFSDLGFTIYSGASCSNMVFDVIQYSPSGFKEYEYNKNFSTTYTIKLNQGGICDFNIQTYGYFN